jgi:adenylate cyclase
MAASVWGSFFNDSNEDITQLSPRLTRPGSQDDGMGFPRDDRRPSMASATTVSSTGSKSSGTRAGYHKRLQNVFGEDFPQDSRQNSDTSLPAPYVTEAQSLRAGRNRANSQNNTLGSSFNSRPNSPVGSRPRTPLPSSEVTPWEYQDYKVSAVESGTFGAVAWGCVGGDARRTCPLMASTAPGQPRLLACAELAKNGN